MGTDETDALRAEIKHLRADLNRAAPSLEGMLALRGFHIHVKQLGDDLLLPASEHRDNFFELMKRYSFRLFLRDVIKHQDGFTVHDVAKYATRDVTHEYINYLLSAGLVDEENGKYRLPKHMKSFGATLEWFMAELINREFQTEALWGLRFRGRPVGGDYDLIARLDCSLLYMEIKSSPPRQVYLSEVVAFLDRVEDLSPALAVFFMDTELRMKDKLVPMFEEVLAARYKSPPPVVRMEKELFHIQDKMFIINAKDTVAGNLRAVLGWYYRRLQ
jgi:hypothetical protein